MIHLLRQHATPVQLREMAATLGFYIKLAVDIERGVIAGGGELHADCEALLLEDGSRQVDVWGADWIPEKQQVTFEALINIRPLQNNPALEIQDPAVRAKVEHLVRTLLEGE